MLVVLASSCNSMDRKLSGKWFLEFHDSAYSDTGLKQVPHEKPFEYIEFDSGEVLIDGEPTTYQVVDDSNITISIGGQEYNFMVTSMFLNGKDRLMLTSLDYTKKDISSYLFVKI